MMKKAFFLCAALWCSFILNATTTSDDALRCFSINSGFQSKDLASTTGERNFPEFTTSKKSGTFFLKKSEKRLSKTCAKAANEAGETIDEDKLSLRALHLGITSIILVILGYLSVFALSTGIMFLLLAILSMITGIAAIARAKKVLKNKEADPRFRKRARIGLTLAIMGIFFSALPYIARILSAFASAG